MHNRCILITDRDHYLSESAISLCEESFSEVAVFDENDTAISDRSIASLHCDLLVSFLNERILPSELLRFQNVNFHPGPPQYPGRGGASYALFDSAQTYGATAHVMAERVDEGAILLVEEFSTEGYTRCETLFSRAERACVDLLAHLLAVFCRTGKLPPPNGMKWARRPGTRKQFDQWLILDPEDEIAFARKVSSSYHSKFPGPYVFVKGLKFGLVKCTDSDRIIRTLSQSAKLTPKK